MNANWNYPTNIRAGIGLIKELPDVCRSLNVQSPLLVTDSGLAESQMLKTILQDCSSRGLDIKVFSEIKPNPTGSNVELGMKAYHQGRHDGVIAFGGGSGIDAGKAIALAANQKCSLWDLEDIGDNWLKADPLQIPPIIGIPTTAGTGSEVGRASVIINESENKKTIVFHPNMLPKIVILDPELTVGLPQGLTAATGMDALSHCLEAYCSKVFHPMAEGIAIEGIRLVKEFLPIVFKDGSNMEARMQMLVASSMGATSFQRGLGAMHALAHPLGAIYDVHHGMLNAVLMPYVLKANEKDIQIPIERLARYLNLEPSFNAFLDWVLQLRNELNIPHTLQTIIADSSKFDEIGRMAVDDPSAITNPISFSACEYLAILKNAFNGTVR